MYLALAFMILPHFGFAEVVQNLLAGWVVSNSNNSIYLNATVPGCVHTGIFYLPLPSTDLIRTGVIGDPDYRRAFIHLVKCISLPYFYLNNAQI